MSEYPNLKGRVVMLSGPITGVDHYREIFDHWRRVAEREGAKIVLTPTVLPSGWKYRWYMGHTLLMVEHADAVFMLPGWMDSVGALMEHRRARELGRERIYAEKI